MNNFPITFLLFSIYIYHLGCWENTFVNPSVFRSGFTIFFSCSPNIPRGVLSIPHNNTRTNLLLPLLPMFQNMFINTIKQCSNLQSLIYGNQSCFHSSYTAKNDASPNYVNITATTTHSYDK